MLSPDGQHLYFTRALYAGNSGGKFSGLDVWFSRLVEVFQACRGNYEAPGAFRQYADATRDAQAGSLRGRLRRSRRR